VIISAFNHNLPLDWQLEHIILEVCHLLKFISYWS
jgi:hypothetical protein